MTLRDTELSAVEILLVDGSPDAKNYANVLRQQFPTVIVTDHQRTAIQYIQRATPALVVASMNLEDGSAVEICVAAKARPVPPSLLVTTDNPEAVPDVLVAGCESILLKPIAPSLLINRAARLLRGRAAQIRRRASSATDKADHLRDRIESRRTGVNREWPSLVCPYCANQEVTSFDYASNRRAWYACLRCRKVWTGKRLDT